MFINLFFTSASFEVTIGEELVHSKLKDGGFPDFDKVAEAVVAAHKG